MNCSAQDQRAVGPPAPLLSRHDARLHPSHTTFDGRSCRYRQRGPFPFQEHACSMSPCPRGYYNSKFLRTKALQLARVSQHPPLTALTCPDCAGEQESGREQGPFVCRTFPFYPYAKFCPPPSSPLLIRAAYFRTWRIDSSYVSVSTGYGVLSLPPCANEYRAGSS